MAKIILSFTTATTVVDAFRAYNRRGSACFPGVTWTAGAALGRFVGPLGHHDA